MNGLAAALATSEGRQREFLLSVSHELRTPLTAIRGYAEALADGVIEADGTADTGRTVLAEAQHLDRLIGDLLALARLEAADFPLEPVPVDLTRLAVDAEPTWSAAARRWECRSGWRRRVGRCRRTPIRGGSGRWWTDCWRTRCGSYPGGAGGARGPAGRRGPGRRRRAGGPRRRARLHRRRPGGGVRAGCAARALPGVRKVGSGLGLALAAGLVRRLGGEIVAGHAPEGGAAFTVRLPGDPYRTRTSA
ncbi:hypothetical protein GCM10027614_50630 [Micromonospora vulcania]